MTMEAKVHSVRHLVKNEDKIFISSIILKILK